MLLQRLKSDSGGINIITVITVMFSLIVLSFCVEWTCKIYFYSMFREDLQFVLSDYSVCSAVDSAKSVRRMNFEDYKYNEDCFYDLYNENMTEYDTGIPVLSYEFTDSATIVCCSVNLKIPISFIGNNTSVIEIPVTVKSSFNYK